MSSINIRGACRIWHTEDEPGQGDIEIIELVSSLGNSFQRPSASNFVECLICIVSYSLKLLLCSAEAEPRGTVKRSEQSDAALYYIHLRGNQRLLGTILQSPAVGVAASDRLSGRTALFAEKKARRPIGTRHVRHSDVDFRLVESDEDHDSRQHSWFLDPKTPLGCPVAPQRMDKVAAVPYRRCG